MSYPLKFTIHRRGKLKLEQTPNGVKETRGPGDSVAVFAYAVVNGTTSQTSETRFEAPLFRTVERLQVIARPGAFPYMWGDGRTVVTLPDGTGQQDWERVDAEENYDNNPFWAPGMSVFYFERVDTGF